MCVGEESLLWCGLDFHCAEILGKRPIPSCLDVMGGYV